MSMEAAAHLSFGAIPPRSQGSGPVSDGPMSPAARMQVRIGEAAPTTYELFATDPQSNTAPPDIIRKQYGRIAIGHSELRGHQYWSGAAGEGRRAVESLLDSYF